ncbi:ABC transporter permease [bacterium]|nr:ABC transporter permease [bacterium]
MPNNNFNLETAIDTWKAFFKHRPAFFQDDLEELELHLREHIAELIQEGHSDEEAFREASSKLGNVTQLDDAFKTVVWPKIKHKKQVASSLLGQISMIRSYLKSAVRNLVKQKGYSSLNIGGLMVGLACSFLVFIWIQTQLSVDAFHEHADRLYQVKVNSLEGLETKTWSNAPAPLAFHLETEFSEVGAAILSMPIRASLRNEDVAVREVGFFAGPAFFEAFTFPFLAGDPASALDAPGQIAISSTLASKLFGKKWQAEGSAIGELISLDYWQSNGGVLGNAVRIDAKAEYIVTGVFEDVPSNSSLSFDFVLPTQDVFNVFGHLTSWGPRWFELYVLLNENASGAELAPKMQSVLSANDTSAKDQQLILQPFAETYLHGSFEQGHPAGGLIERLYLIGLVGLAILLIACINFTNLLTARSSQRAREIGVRKVIGATPSALVHQFLGEAFLTAMIAFVGAILLMILVMPLFNLATGLDAALSDQSPGTWLTFFGIAVAAGLLAGVYPAFVLSSMNVIRVFQGHGGRLKQKGVRMREGLVIFQFAVSVFLVVATMTIYQQIDFLRSKDLGLDKENVVMMRIEGDLGTQFESARTQLLRSSAILNVSKSSAHPLGVAIINSNVNWEGKQEGDLVLFKVLETDEYFAETMKLHMVAGRYFDGSVDTGQLNYVVNEEAVRALGLESPIGYPLALGYEVEGDGTGTGKIVGVVKDFHSGSLVDQQIGPMILRYEPDAANFLLARVAGDRTAEGLADLKDMNDQFNPSYPFEYSFLDAEYDSYYSDEVVIGILSRAFALVAILIALLGLLGLTAFSVQQRAKEVGVRLVMGATKRDIVVLLSRELVQLVALSLILALPAAYWIMKQWLTSFAYRVEMSWVTLTVAAGISLLLAITTVGYQAYRAALQKPTSLLRSE